jgi:FAD/FMN-containing dehydrogenase
VEHELVPGAPAPGLEVMAPREPTLAGWGNLPVPGRERRGEDLAALTRGAVLSRGLGRSYGDAALPPAGQREVVGTRRADRILAFDPGSGVLRAEAGLALRALHRALLPHGWFAPVVPGTEEVTLGGMVAADVHGKNHHRAGSLGRHVRALWLRTADQRVLRCSRQEEPELFRATLGGMGLTGHLLEVELVLERVPSPWICCETRRFARLAPLVDALREASVRWPFTVAWLDCLASDPALGRGVLFCGRWCEPDEAPRERPAPPRALPHPPLAPGWLLSPPAVALFNRLYLLSRREGRRVVHPASFFYPLDRLPRWSRLYGRRGMTQHQCVLPGADAAAVTQLLHTVRAHGGACFLAVLKDFGEEGEGLLSFPRPGLTLALDFAVDARTPALVAAINREVLAAGGRVYLAKDAFTTAGDFAQMERERLPAFLSVCRRWDPEGRLRSRLAERLGLVPTGAGATPSTVERVASELAAAARGAASGPTP